MAASGSGIRAGRAYVEISANAASLKQQIHAMGASLRAQLKKAANVGGQLTSIGGAFMGLGGKIAGVGGLAAAAFVKPIQAASDFGETLSKFRTVFGDNADATKEWSDNFASQVGRSKAEMMGFLANSRAVLEPFGFDKSQADDLSKTLTELAVDLASFHNTSDADAMQALVSGMMGETEPLKRFGIVVNETRAKTQALADGIDWNKASEGQKVLSRMAVVLKDSSQAQGDATRTAGSFANRLKALKGGLHDTAVEVGNALLPALQPIVTLAADAAKRFGEWAQANGPMVAMAGKLAVGLFAGGAALLALGSAASAAGAVITGTTAVVGALMSPLALIPVLLAGGVAAFLKFTDAGQAMGETFRATFGGIVDALKSGDLEGAGRIAWAGLQAAWTQGVAGLEEKWATWKAGFLSLSGDAMQGFANIFGTTTDRIFAAWEELTSKMRGLWGGTTDWLSDRVLELMHTFDPSFDLDEAKRDIARQRGEKNFAWNAGAAGRKASFDGLFDKGKIEADKQDAIARAQAKAAAASEHLAATIEDAQAADAAAALAGTTFTGAVAKTLGPNLRGPGSTVDAAKSDVYGTFSAFAAGRQFNPNAPEALTAKFTKITAAQLIESNSQLGKIRDDLKDALRVY